MSKIPTTPKELIAALQSGDEIDDARWEQFDELYRPVIRLFLEQKFGTRVSDCGEDIAQDVIIRLVAAFRNRQYDPSKGRFRRYLAAMSYNAAVNALRRLHPERTLALDEIDLATLADSSAPDPCSRLERQFLEAEFQRMTRLYFTNFAHDPSDRAVWDAYLHGENSTVTAERLGKTPEAIRQQRKRILRTIKALAEES